MFKDKEVQCLDCGQMFIIEAGEQEFFKSKGFSLPKRCQECRAKRKIEKMNGR